MKLLCLHPLMQLISQVNLGWVGYYLAHQLQYQQSQYKLPPGYQLGGHHGQESSHQSTLDRSACTGDEGIVSMDNNPSSHTTSHSVHGRITSNDDGSNAAAVAQHTNMDDVYVHSWVSNAMSAACKSAMVGGVAAASISMAACLLQKGAMNRSDMNRAAECGAVSAAASAASAAAAVAAESRVAGGAVGGLVVTAYNMSKCCEQDKSAKQLCYLKEAAQGTAGSTTALGVGALCSASLAPASPVLAAVGCPLVAFMASWKARVMALQMVEDIQQQAHVHT